MAECLYKDQNVKFKLLGTLVASVAFTYKEHQRSQLASAFRKWKQNSTMAKVVETAFNKLLEMNYAHAGTRFKTAGFLLKKAVKRLSRKAAFDNIRAFSRMTLLSLKH